MRSGVTFQVEGIVEAFATECAQVTLHIAVTLHVAIQQTLETEGLAAHFACQPEIGEEQQTLVTASPEVLIKSQCVQGFSILRSDPKKEIF